MTPSTTAKKVVTMVVLVLVSATTAYIFLSTYQEKRQTFAVYQMNEVMADLAVVVTLGAIVYVAVKGYQAVS